MENKKFFLFINLLLILFTLIICSHKEGEIDDINKNISTEDIKDGDNKMDGMKKEDIKKEEIKREEIKPEEFFNTLDFSTVVTYNDSNYIPRIKNDKPLFMYVYEPSCLECQKTIPIFIALSDFLKENKTDITMAQVNAQENPEFCKDYKINKEEIPKLLYIGRDRKVLEYKYEITRYNLLKFLNKKLYGDILSFEEMAQVNKTVADKKYKEHQVFVLSTLAFDYKKEIFNKYAAENDREIFIQCFSIECYNEYNEDIVIYKDFDEKVILYSDHFKSGSDRLEVDKIKKFVMRYSVEAGGILESEHFLLSKDYKRKMIIYFRDSSDEKQISYDKYLKEAGLELRKKVGYTFVADIKGDEFFEKVAKDLVISKSELPTLLYVDKVNSKEIQKCKTYRITNVDLNKLNGKYVLKFAKDVEKKKIARDLKTEFPPEKSEIESYSPFKVVVGRTYDKEIVLQKKNILIVFIDTRNELSYKYLEVIKEFREKSEIGKDLVYALMDGVNNEARGISFDESDLPFIYFYTNGESVKSKYKCKPKEKESLTKEYLELFVNEALKGNDVKEDL